jgi:hypothetical protein
VPLLALGDALGASLGPGLSLGSGLVSISTLRATALLAVFVSVMSR